MISVTILSVVPHSLFGLGFFLNARFMLIYMILIDILMELQINTYLYLVDTTTVEASGGHEDEKRLIGLPDDSKGWFLVLQYCSIQSCLN